MSRRITITLTDEEYAILEQRAAQDRRSPREMAAYLMTRQPSWTDYIRPVPYVAPIQQPWTTYTTGNTDQLCPACTNPRTTADHTCVRMTSTLTSHLN